jgi:membrane-bound ClpP family serine protease
MIGQTTVDVGQLAPVFALIAAFVVVFGPLATGLTKLVDGIRYFDKDDDPRFKILWIAAAFVIAIAVCLAFQINLAAALVAQVPALSTTTALAGVWGQVLTAVGMAGMAGYQHERMDKNSSEAKVANSFGTAELIDPAE